MRTRILLGIALIWLVAGRGSRDQWASGPLLLRPGAESGGRRPAAGVSFASLEPENLVLTALKPAEDGEGLIVRVLETAGHASDGV